MKTTLSVFLVLGLLLSVPVQAQQITAISLPTKDLLYEPVSGKLYASVPGSVGSNGNSIAVIDPATATVERFVWVGSEPNRLAASDDGQYLYVGLDGAYAVRRVHLPTLAPGLQFGLGGPTTRAAGIAVMPGAAGTVAVARTTGSSTTSTAIYDDGVQRPTATASDYHGGALTFGASATRLYNADDYSSSNYFTRMTVGASGVSIHDITRGLTSSTSRMSFVGGRLYTNLGAVVDPEALTRIGTFPMTLLSVAIDPAQPFAYGLTSSSASSTLHAFDRATLRQLWTLNIPNVNAEAPLVRWSPNRLAFRTADKLVLVNATGTNAMAVGKEGTGNGTITSVPPGVNCGSTCTALFPNSQTVTLTATPDATSRFVEWLGDPDCTDGNISMASAHTCRASFAPLSQSPARQVPLAANDLVYSAASGKLYASIGGADPLLGNSVCEIDPATGDVLRSVWVGSDPSRLALSDDGGTMYVGLNGTSAVRRVDMATFTAGLQFSLGYPTYGGLIKALDLAVVPGDPTSVAVAIGESPGSLERVAVFTNGALRSKTVTSSDASSWIVFGASSSTLYGVRSNYLTRMSVASDGITSADEWRLFGGNSQKVVFDHGRLYSAAGAVIDPEAPTKVGTLKIDAASGITTDYSAGRVYAISQSSSSRLTAFSLTDLTRSWSFAVPGSRGTPTGLVSTGLGTLAFRTSEGQVFLVDTSSGHPLTVTKSGTGGGTVTSSPEAISCGSRCSALLPAGAGVTLTAVPNEDSRFVGWTGDSDCADGEVVMTAASSCTAVFAQLTTGRGRQFPLPSNDLAYSSATGLLYASVPSGHPTLGNSVVAIDPATGSIIGSVVVGSEPGRLELSSDGRTLYVGLDGAAAVRRVDVTTMTAGTQFGVGLDGYTEPYGVGDLAVAPGDADTIAVSRTRYGSFTSIAVFTNGVARTSDEDSGYITYSESPGRLYSNYWGTLKRFDVRPDGITLAESTASLLGSGPIRFEQGRIYSQGGRVIDPVTRSVVATFPLSSSNSSEAAPDVANGSVYFVERPSSLNPAIRQYSTTTFALTGTQQVSAGADSARDLVACGVNRVAFRTSSDQLFIVTMGEAVTHTLTIAASNPSGEVPISVSPADLGGLSSGVTPLPRSYAAGATITLTAPATSGGNVFVSWKRGYTVLSTSPTVAVNLDSSFTVTAVYQYPAPSLAAVQPGSGPTAGGTPVTITGGNFRNGATVLIGGIAATSVVVVDATTITAVTPAHAAGVVSVSVAGAGGVTILPNSFTFVAPVQIPVVPAYDFNGDGRQDILWTNGTTGQARVWFTNGGTLAGQAALASPGAGWELAAGADVDANGKSDLLWRNYSTGANTVWYMNGTAMVSQAALPAVADTNWRVVAVADLNADARPDLVWRHQVTGYNSVWFMNGTTLVGETMLPPVPEIAWQLVGTADFNGDAKPDILWRHAVSGQNVVWYMDGATMQSQVFLPPVLDTAWQIALTADFNADGRTDILWRNTSTGQNGLWFMDGLLFIGSAALPVDADQKWRMVGQPGQARPKVAGDFNGDGTPDIIWRQQVSGMNVVWCMNGATFLNQVLLPQVSDANWQIAARADFDGDGWPDLAWRNGVTGQNVLWLMHGTAFWSQVLLPPVSETTWRMAAAADFTGDGKPDILWRNGTTGQNVVWVMNGTAFVSQAVLPPVADTNWRVYAAADFTGDAKPDVLWRNRTTGQNVVWVMNGTNFVSQTLLPPVPDASWQPGMAADFNSDGSTDIVWRNYSTGQNVIWFMNGTTFLNQALLPPVADMNWGMPGRQ